MTPCPKPRPALLDKRDRASATAATDRAERVKCRVRSGGRCEVVTERIRNLDIAYAMYLEVRRCPRRASANHHLKGGIGRRNRGDSILAEHRIEVCSICHSEITGHVLQPVGPGREDAATVRFERVR